MSFSVKRAEDSPGFLLWQLTNQWQRQQRQALAKLGLTHGQFVVLAAMLWLSHTSDKPITQQQVSDFTKIDKMSMSDLVGLLLKKNWLYRAPDIKDKRAYCLSLTDAGRQLALQAIPIVEGIDQTFFSHDTPALLQLIQRLQHLLEPRP